MSKKISVYVVGFCCLLGFLVAVKGISAQGQTTSTPKYIDVHNHIHAKMRGPSGMTQTYEETIQATLKEMDRYGIEKMIVMPPPFRPDNRMKYEMDVMIPYLKKYPTRFAYLSGGGTLAPMMHTALSQGKTTEQMKTAFKNKANELLRQGAIGFGEFAIEHFALSPNHNHQNFPADHPLFFLLADIAAEKNVPIDIHMEAIASQIPLPSRLSSPPNPNTLSPNIAAFERLLSHNANAKIIWSHMGWCSTGHRTIALMRDLFQRHPNLYMSLKISLSDSSPEITPLQNDQTIKPEWIEFMREFPDRFLIGADNFYRTGQTNRIGPDSAGPTNAFFKQLPADLAQKIGVDNAKKIFGI